jgi:AbiV family abortive infection protein
LILRRLTLRLLPRANERGVGGTWEPLDMRTVPERDHLLALVGALIANARTLLDDASLLLEHGRFPRAYALAALAGEEVGKVYLCLDALLSPGPVDPRQFWWGWRQHGDKLDSMRAYTAAFVQDLDDLVVEQLGPDARRVSERKLSALYVDFDGNEPVTPNCVTEGEAADLLRQTRLAIGHLEGALSGLNSVVVDAIHELGPALEAFFDQVVDDRPPQEVLAELRQLLLDLPGMDINELSGLLAPKRDRPESGALAGDG